MPSQLQGHSVYLCDEQRYFCLAWRNCSPAGEQHDRAGPSIRDEVFTWNYFIVPKKSGGYDQSWTCVFSTGPFTISHSGCWGRDTFLNASILSIGLQWSTWRTCTFMSLSSLNTGRFSYLRSKGEHIGTRSSTSGCLCHLVSSPRSWRQPLFHLGKEVFAFSTTSMTGSYWPSLEGSYVNTSTQCSGTSASWGFGSAGKITNSPLCRESLFSVCSWTHQPHSTSLNRTCSVDAELPGLFPAQEGGSTETVSEGPGAYVQGPDCSGISTTLSCSMACSASLQIAAIQQPRAGQYGQHCECCVHEPSRQSTLLSHVTTRPPSPPLESEASEVATRRSCPRRAQSCSRRAFTSAPPSGRMGTPPRDSPADLETLRGRSGRHVCLPGHVPLPAVLLSVRRDPRLALSWPLGLRKYAFPPVSLLAQTLCKVRDNEEQVLSVALY